MGSEEESLQYAGFWRRLGAFALDFIAFLPFLFIALVAGERFYLFPLYSIPPIAVFSLFYSVYLVQRFGGTPGKLLMGLRIRKLDGSPIDFRAALIRFLPEFVLWLVGSIGLALPVLDITDPAFLQLGFVERNKVLAEMAPPWYQMVSITQTVWTWSEFLVLLTNRKRRALHDFLAGTVVIVQRKQMLAGAVNNPQV